jgi:hypothetical protein
MLSGLLCPPFCAPVGRVVWAPAMSLLGSLADGAVQEGLASLGMCSPQGALQELSMALCWGNTSLCWSGWYAATGVIGQILVRRLVWPSPEVR